MALPDIVAEVRKTLEGAKVFDAVAAVWTTLTWQEKPTQMVALEAEFYAPGSIIIYPGTGDEALKKRAILRAFGKALAYRMRGETKKRWDNLYAVVDPDHVTSFTAALKGNYASFRSIVEHSQNPIERLTHIHLGNAFIINHLAVRSADSVDVTKWPATEQYANQKRAHSLIPVVTAYWPESRAFADMFSAWIDDGLQGCYHTAVRREIIKLIESTIREIVEPHPSLPK